MVRARIYARLYLYTHRTSRREWNPRLSLLIDCFCHLATVKGFRAIVSFNYELNYLSRLPAFPTFNSCALARESRRWGFVFKVLFPVDRGSLR